MLKAKILILLERNAQTKSTKETFLAVVDFAVFKTTINAILNSLLLHRLFYGSNSVQLLMLEPNRFKLYYLHSGDYMI